MKLQLVQQPIIAIIAYLLPHSFARHPSAVSTDTIYANLKFNDQWISDGPDMEGVAKVILDSFKSSGFFYSELDPRFRQEQNYFNV